MNVRVVLEPRWRQLVQRLLDWWRGPPAPLPPLPAPVPPPEPAKPVQAAVARKNKEWPQDDAAWHFKEDILDQLDQYMVFIRRMKSVDPFAYEIYHRIGGTLLPRSGYLAPLPELPPRWRAGYRGSFGCVALGVSSAQQRQEEAIRNTKEAWIGARFIYFTRLDEAPPIWVEKIDGGSIYVMTLHYDIQNDKRWRHGWGYPIYLHVDDQARVRLLKVIEVSKTFIRHHDRHGNGTSEVPTGLHLRYPSHLQRRFEDKKWKDFPDDDIHTWVTRLFGMMADALDRPGMVRVAASKEHLTAAFSVDIERTPDFFADRDHTFNENGQKKRIFHIVRAHRRKGRPVRISFRGKRVFDWNGYHVRITVPGWHHNDVSNFETAAHIAEKVPHRGFVGAARMARMIQRHLQA